MSVIVDELAAERSAGLGQYHALLQAEELGDSSYEP